MKKLVAGLLVLTLAGCGNFAKSGWNPANWFGKSKPQPAASQPVSATDPALSDPRPMMQSVTGVTVERASGGVILRATGVPPGPGYWGAVLIPLAQEKPVGGALVYLFRASPPLNGSVPRPQHLTAARFVNDKALAGARSIVVRAAANERRSAP